MSGFDRYAHDDEGQLCPKCRRRALYYDKVIRAWACVACRYRDR